MIPPAERLTAEQLDDLRRMFNAASRIHASSVSRRQLRRFFVQHDLAVVGELLARVPTRPTTERSIHEAPGEGGPDHPL